jgi:hypothetical protein
MGGEAPQVPSERSHPADAPPPYPLRGICGWVPINFFILRIFGWFNGKLTKLRGILSIGETETKSIVKPIKKYDRAPVGAFDRKSSLTF